MKSYDDNYTSLNRYRSMWIMVMFDLPTDTAAEKRIAVRFRKGLLADGFNMFQFSVYTRFCASGENGETHANRIMKLLPDSGNVSIIQFTDRQYGMMKRFNGTKAYDPDKGWQQMELF